MEYHKVKINENESIRKIILRKFPADIPDVIRATEKLTLPIIRTLATNMLITNPLTIIFTP